MDYRLRDSEIADFEALWRIDQKCFLPGISYSRPELSAYMRMQQSFTIVAEARPAGTIVGFITAESNRRRTGHIITIDVLPEGRRLGVGSQLLAAAEERLRSVECVRVILEAAVDNASALAFYERHGYAAIKKIPQYYSNGVDALTFEKHLYSGASHADFAR